MTLPEAKSKPSVIIRDLESIEDLRRVQPVEKEVWDLADRDLAPMTMLIALREAGSILLGAFDADALIGFAFGFPALQQGQLSIHSHMLAVLPQYRNLNLGYRLKLAQRERALAKRIQQITWTFDPLQSRNAHFNFTKLGVIADRYKVDFYGRDSSSFLHQNGTDRLWVTWPLASRRVQQRLQAPPREILEFRPATAPLLSLDGHSRPVRSDVAVALAGRRVSIEVPADISTLEKQDAALAWEWRLATRWAFTEALNAGFFVAEFLRSPCGQPRGAYLLLRGQWSDN